MTGGYGFELARVVGADCRSMCECPPPVAFFGLQFKLLHTVELFNDSGSVECRWFSQIDFQPNLACCRRAEEEAADCLHRVQLQVGKNFRGVRHPSTIGLGASARGLSDPSAQGHPPGTGPSGHLSP